jgi:hypothetical protein
MRVLVIAITVVFASTNTGADPYAPSASARPAPAQSPKPSPAAPTAAQLDQLLAPIALYPDSLLAHMLLCAANPAKIGALAEWLLSNKSLKGTELQDAAAKSGFDQSFVALVMFPQVVNYMADQIDWTTKLGKAFTDHRSAVFDSVQRLRTKARNAGTLKSTPQQEVETKTTSSGSEVIVIEPTNPQVVYVPQYNPTVVYTQPSTVVVQQESDNSAAVAAGVIGFTAGIAIGAAMDNNYYYGPYGWHGGGYMYNDAWDDYFDEREDAREDWQDHREDIADERGDRAKNTQEQRTDRQENRQENGPQTQADREQRRTETQTAAQGRTTNQESRGYSGNTQKGSGDRSGTKSDAFSGYSSGKSERAASQRGKSNRGSSRSGGSRRR